jgi:hypothetical protein
MDFNDKLTKEYLYFAGANGFGDTWEQFTCKLLNLENDTAQIIIRKPPEQGVDLFYQKLGYAYQCKSVENGIDNEFNVTQAKQSISSALKIKDSLNWKEYYLCTNVEITGNQTTLLREIYKDLIILPKSYWITLCEKFSNFVEINFRKELILPKPSKATSNKSINDFYTENMLAKLNENSYDIHFYTQEHDKIYTIEVSDGFLVSELIDTIAAFLNRPSPLIVEYGSRTKVELSYILRINDKDLNPKKTLKELGIFAKSFIQLYVNYIVRQENRYANDKFMSFMTQEMMTETVNPEKAKIEAKEKAVIKNMSLFNEMDKKNEHNI